MLRKRGFAQVELHVNFAVAKLGNRLHVDGGEAERFVEAQCAVPIAPVCGELALDDADVPTPSCDTDDSPATSTSDERPVEAAVTLRLADDLSDGDLVMGIMMRAGWARRGRG